MSVEYKTETKTIKSKVIKCDFCGNVIDGYSPCVVCGLDVCWRCKHDEYEWDSDYPTRYCVKCWEAGEEYRKEMRDIELESDEKIERIQKEWYSEARKLHGIKKEG